MPCFGPKMSQPQEFAAITLWISGLAVHKFYMLTLLKDLKFFQCQCKDFQQVVRVYTFTKLSSFYLRATETRSVV